MERRCMNCMNVFKIPAGYEDKDFCCPFCGFVENTPPEEDKYLNPGVVINERYTVGTVIAAGGFGVTYRAWDRILDSQIAIKEYYPVGLAARSDDKISVSVLPAGEKTTFERGKERFLKEARSLAKFNNNPGTVTIYDFFEQNGTAYITMEYLDGCNMSEYIESEDASVSLDMIMDITDAICDVLSAVHSNGVIHRDISPENIFAEANGTYKLIDFGAAKQQISDEQSSLTVILKHDYAPLEQFSQKGNVGPWTDIYSLGASLYKILTGVTPKESIQRIMHDDIVDARKLRPDIPEYVSDAIMKAMAIQITDRFTSALDFKNAMHGEGKEKNAEKSDKGDVALPENKNHKGGIEQQELDMGKELQEQALNESGNDSFLDINDFINFDDTEVAQQSTQILRQMQEQAAQDGSQILSAKPSQVPGGDAAPQQAEPESAPQQSAPAPEPAQHTGNTGTLSMSTPKMSLASSNNNVRKSKGISAVIEQQTNILRATDDAAKVAQASMEAEGEKKRKGLGSLFGKKK